ncbi:MAG: DUF1552 domain-containing protein, partial [Deltaproteobacteria bacterium]|nr:DUF1552 domain-containing protein [Deltaproteobacteria bacterium]
VRFLGIRTPHGADRDYWVPHLPTGGAPTATDQPLGELTFEYADAALTPLTPWRDRITVLDGLDTQVVKEQTRFGVRNLHGHNEQGVLLTGAQPPTSRSGNYDNHPSLDFYLHGRLGAPVLLTASVEDSSTWKCMSYDDRGQPRRAEMDPRALFRQAFPADFVPPAVGEPPPPTVVDYSAGEGRIASQYLRSLERLRDRLGGTERAKIQSHIDAMTRLQPPGGAPGGPGGGGSPVGACLTSGTDVPTRDGTPRSVAGVEEVARAHARVITQAFACGRSRVATLEILNDYPNYFTDLPEVRIPEVTALVGGSYRFHEDLVHRYWSSSGTTRTTLRKAYHAGLRWSASHFAAVLAELDAVADPLDPAGRSILDNTIVFWHSEFGHGGHDNQDTRQPCVIAGGGGRTLKLGRYLRLRNIDSNERVPHNLLLTSIAQAVGLGDVNYFGDRDLVGRANYQGPLLPLMA